MVFDLGFSSSNAFLGSSVISSSSSDSLSVLIIGVDSSLIGISDWLSDLDSFLGGLLKCSTDSCWSLKLTFFLVFGLVKGGLSLSFFFDCKVNPF